MGHLHNIEAISDGWYVGGPFVRDPSRRQTKKKDFNCPNTADWVYDLIRREPRGFH